MRWKIKALTQMAASQLPFAPRLNYLGQKLVMRRFGSIDRSVADRFQRARWFAAAWQGHNNIPLSGVTHYEVGAGWHLAVPLSLWCLGLERQITVDVARLARVELINRAIDCLQRLPVDMARRPRRTVRRIEQLEDFYGIAYWAPCDARSLPLPAESVDWFTSTLTLQHIPVPVLRGILAEARRVLKPFGLLLGYIDYADNYAYTDRTITVYNFLRFSESQWRWFNPSLHYQNRLRHVQYRRLLQEAGFTILHETINGGSERDISIIKAMNLAREFAGFRAEELAVRSARIAAAKAEADGLPYSGHASGRIAGEGS